MTPFCQAFECNGFIWVTLKRCLLDPMTAFEPCLVVNFKWVSADTCVMGTLVSSFLRAIFLFSYKKIKIISKRSMTGDRNNGALTLPIVCLSLLPYMIGLMPISE